MDKINFFVCLLFSIIAWTNSQVIFSDPKCGQLSVPDPNAYPGELRWTAKVSVKGSPKYCMANFVASHWLLGAASCISDRIPVAHYIINITDPNTGTDRTMEIDKVMKSPKFNPTLGAGYDVALIRLKRTMSFSDKGIRPICLADYDPQYQIRVDVNSVCYNLAGTRVKPISDDLCKDQFNVNYDKQYMFCADQVNCLDQTNPSATTNGSPIICQYHKRWYLAGMASWGRNCAVKSSKPQYEAYTKLIGESNYIVWINSTIHPNKSFN